MSRNSGGTIAIIITIIVTGGLIYLGLAANQRSSPTAQSASTSDTSSHHSSTGGPESDLNSLVGQPAPDFKFKDRFDREYSRDGLKGKNVILFFNEGLMCYPACWNQIAALGEDERMTKNDTVALSVVIDSATDWQQAVKKMPSLSVATVVHDGGGKISKSFGMLTTASSMHYGQYPGHSYVVIDKEGIIRHVYDDPNMSIHNDVLIEEIAKLS